MAVSAFQKVLNKLFQQFIRLNGREPQTPKEWMDIQNEAVQFFNKTKGAPAKPKAPPFQGWKPEVIQGGKGIESLLKSGDVKVGVAPKTTKETLKTKKDRGILLRDAEEDIARIKRENKEAVERFKEKHPKFKKSVEDYRDEGDWDPSGFAGGGPVSLQQLINMYMEEGMSHQDAVQAAEAAQNLPWDTLNKASGGLAYMLGEPTYMKAGGGKVGHGPWTTGQTPPGPQSRPEMPQPQVMGTPDPMKAPRLPSVAPRNMDPQVMQQQMMQQAMMQQGIPQGIPRVGMMYGGDPGFAFEYGGSWADWHDQHRNAMPIEDYIQTKLPKERLPFRQNFSKGGVSRRLFLKMMTGLASLPFIGRGAKEVVKEAPTAIKAAETIARDAEGIPTYAFDLIEVVKAKGTKEIMEGIYKRSPPATKYNYKGVEVVEDGLGNTSVQKQQTKTGSWTDEATDDTLVDDYVDREIGFEIKKGEDLVKDEGLETQKSIRGPDEYNESTAHMRGDPDGTMDVDIVEEIISDADHLELKKIADEIGDVYYEDVNITGKLKRPKKASGGLAHMLGE